MWWPGPKGEHPVKEGTRQKNNLESHAVILPLHLVHQDNYKVLAQVQGERTQTPTSPRTLVILKEKHMGWDVC